MKVWTAHLHPARPPVLIHEGWSWGAALFGPFWLLAHRAWVPGVIVLAVVVILNLLVPNSMRGLLVLGFFLLLGLLGRDLLRWSLARRGYALAHVVTAQDDDAAFARLLDARPDLAAAHEDPAWLR
jgi:ABC-type transport system involved in cytochrome bd biosynthesis fused ATPase/permease subunit